MRVLYDHQMFSIQRFGGITRIFIELLRELSKSPEVSLHWYRGLHRDGYDISDFQGRLGRYQAFAQPPFLLRGRSPEKINRFGLRWFQRMSLHGFDVYHPTYFDLDVGEIARAKRLVITVHDMILERYLWNLERFRPVIERKRRLVERADLIIVNSLSTKTDLVEMTGIDPAKARVTYWASRIGEAQNVPCSAVTQGTPYFLYVGTRSKYKNFEVLMRVFSENEWLARNFQVVCFGGTSPYLPDEMRFFREHSLLDCFRYVSGGDGLLRSLYENAVALVYTSRYEGFGLPPLEAMQCGCPVICAPTSSLPEVVGDAALFFDVDASEQLADCMRRVAEQPELRARLVKKGKARAALFSWERTAQATLDGYRAVCG